MKTDIVLSGVGGQGILSIAAVLDQAAMGAGYHVRQPEVHGMAQRGGAVHAFVRISDRPIPSDLIPEGQADLLISVEPMEALRYLRYLKPEGTVVTDISPFVNIPDYPAAEALYDTLFRAPHIVPVDAGYLARKAGVARAQNMVMLGAASAKLPFSPEAIEGFITENFAAKGERVVKINLTAFRMGRAALAFHDAVCDAGADQQAVARVLPRLEFVGAPVPDAVVSAWATFFRHPSARAVSDRVFRDGAVLPLDPYVPARLLEGSAPADLAAKS